MKALRDNPFFCLYKKRFWRQIVFFIFLFALWFLISWFFRQVYEQLVTGGGVPWAGRWLQWLHYWLFSLLRSDIILGVLIVCRLSPQVEWRALTEQIRLTAISARELVAGRIAMPLILLGALHLVAAPIFYYHIPGEFKQFPLIGNQGWTMLNDVMMYGYISLAVVEDLTFMLAVVILIERCYQANAGIIEKWVPSFILWAFGFGVVIWLSRFIYSLFHGLMYNILGFEVMGSAFWVLLYTSQLWIVVTELIMAYVFWRLALKSASKWLQGDLTNDN